MKNIAAYLVEDKRFDFLEVPIPTIENDDVLVEVKHVGVCGSDIAFFQDHTLGGRRKDIQLPILLGHEASGIIVDKGINVKDLKIGDIVALEPSIPCMKCKFCLEGRYNICPNMDMMAAPPFHRGALQQYITHPASHTFRLPDGMDTLEGSLLEPLCVGMHAVKRSSAEIGKSVLIIGMGCIGFMTMMSAITNGVTDITVADLFQKRLEKANAIADVKTICTKNESLEEIFLANTNGYGADIVFETAGSPITAAMTPYLVARGGTIVLVGNIHGKPEYSFINCINKEADILTVFRYRNLYPTCIDAVANKRIDVKSVVGGVFPINKLQQAFEVAIDHKDNVLKSIIEF